MTPGELETLGGRRLGHYHLQGLLGARGQAVVYHAFDLDQGRELALYIVSPGASESATFGEVFLAAVSRIAALRHPHVLPVYEVGRDERYYYVAVPIERESLRDRLRREGILAPVDAARIVAQAAWAVDALHHEAISGLRLSLDNVLLDEDGLALLADTSVAHGGTTDALVPRVATGLPLGCVQAMAHDARVPASETERADVFALGYLLYELLTGMPPQADSTQQDLASGMLTALLPEEPKTKRIWPELEDVVLNTLADDPRRRYPDARSFAVAIRHAVARFDDGGAGDSPVPTLLKARRTSPPASHGDTGELRAVLHPTVPPALPRPSYPTRPPAARGAVPSRPIAPSRHSPPSAPSTPSRGGSSGPVPDDDAVTTLLPGREAPTDRPPDPPSNQPPNSPAGRAAPPPLRPDSDEELRRILYGNTGGPATTGGPRFTGGAAPSRSAPSGPRRTGTPTPSSLRRSAGPPLPPTIGAARSMPSGPNLAGRSSQVSGPSRPDWSSYAGPPSMPRYGGESQYAETGEHVPYSSQAAYAAVSLRELALAQPTQPAPRSRRANMRLLLACLIGVALVIFCVTGLLAFATSQAEHGTTPAPGGTPSPTTQPLSSNTAIVASATLGSVQPNATHTVPTPTPTPKPTPTSTSTPQPTPTSTPAPTATPTVIHSSGAAVAVARIAPSPSGDDGVAGA